jgi:hypothetical protein
MFNLSIRSLIRKNFPLFSAAVVFALSWFLISDCRYFDDFARDANVRVGYVDVSGRPYFFESFERLKKEYGADSVKAAWDDAQKRGQLYIAVGENLSLFDRANDFERVSASEDDKASLIGRGRNLLADGSFESGSWQPHVFDCDNYDEDASIGMSLDAEDKTDGKQSLRLTAKRHAACVFTDIPISEAGDHLLTFDYQSPSAAEAEFFFSFDDREKTVIYRKLPSVDGSWQEYSGNIAMPKGATTARLYLYADSADGKIDAVNLYDRVYFGKLWPLATIGMTPAKGILNIVKNEAGSWNVEVAAGPWPLVRFYLRIIAYSIALAAFLGYLGWRAIRSRKKALIGYAARSVGILRLVFESVSSKIVRCFWSVATDVRRRPRFLAIAVSLGLLVGWRMGVPAGGLWLLFLLFLLYEWDDRIIGALAIGSLAACPLFIWLKSVNWAETMAVYAFYFLAMISMFKLVSLKRHPDRFCDDESD